MSEALTKPTLSVDDLRRLRDEAKVQLHLASLEAKEEFERLEAKWRAVRPHLEAPREAITEAGGDLAVAMMLLTDELARSYRRLRRELRAS